LGRQLRPVTAARHPVADHRLAATAAVRIGRVEHRDAERPRGVHDPERLLLALAPAEELRRRADAAEVAAAEDDARDLDFGPAEATTLHWRDSRSAGFSDACARRAGAYPTRLPRRRSNPSPRRAAPARASSASRDLRVGSRRGPPR